MTRRVWVIDTSALINCKRVVPAGQQWELFERMKSLVEAGQLCFPRKVTDELRQQRHHDTPETWALHVSGIVRYAYDPDTPFLEQVMRVAGDVVDLDAEEDAGDPYVLAQALQIRTMGYEAAVVSDDVIDHPEKISIATACKRFNTPLVHQSLGEFLAALEESP